VRVTPSNRSAILVARGNDAEHDAEEDPGALRVFRLDDGRLTAAQVVAPKGGLGFRPRHLDFHPAQPWAYVLLESQNELHVYALHPDGTLASEPSFAVSTLADPASAERGQYAGAIHVHPGGTYVYVTNRNSEVEVVDGLQVSRGGENDIAVFAVDRETGEPVPLGHADGHSIHARTFSIHPDGGLLVAASVLPVAMRHESGVRTLPARLVVYRILADGRLEPARTYDVETGGDMQFWSGMVTLPG
jgi:6-phosphogluconolactonase (cycloisomerase 2 family)